MPTQAEWQELLDNTNMTWTQQGGVNGRLFTASNGNSLFLPAAGCRSNGDLINVGSFGNYWSSSLSADSPIRAWSFYFGLGSSSMGPSLRSEGFTVRPVREN